MKRIVLSFALCLCLIVPLAIMGCGGEKPEPTDEAVTEEIAPPAEESAPVEAEEAPMPETAIEWQRHGVNLSLEGKNDEALEAFNTSIELDPELGWAYYGRAEIYKKLGMNDEALADYDTACGLEIDAACDAAESLRTLIGG